MSGTARSCRSPRRRSIASPLLRDRDQGSLRSAGRAADAPDRDGTLLAAFFDWAGKVVTRLSAKSELDDAFRYTLKRQDALSRFLTDARLEIGNNVAENAMRGIALGRKNYLFAGSNAGGERAAAIYSIMQTARLNDRNPEAYLRSILGRTAAGHPINRISELLPWQLSPST
ncbi:MAG TPA: transposase [Acetobacteraceae bacterium]|nr:transposase [Acetobacteraceae bacterium]